MKPREYCCCAIPVMNAGIYATLAEQFTLALLVAILALATPSIVGALSTPSIGKIILAIICFAAAGVQVLGFLGVFKEKAVMFRRYTTLHIVLTLAAFSVAATWIVLSAVKHDDNVTECEQKFFDNSTTTTTGETTLDEGHTLCNIFSWVTVGLMGGLWLILAIMQLYLYTIISSYGTGQRRDHDQYKSIYSVTGIESGAIPLSDRADPWDARPSIDDDRDARYAPVSRDIGHRRDESSASVSTILAEKPQQEAVSVHSVPSDNAYGGPPGGYAYPSNAYTHEPQPTPQAFGSNAGYYGANPTYAYGTDNLGMPGRTQAHPAAGMFGRKTSRLQKVEPRDF